MTTPRPTPRSLPLLACILATALAPLGGCPQKGSSASSEPAGYQGPRLTIDSPARGAMLAEGTSDPSPVTVRGQACDEAHAVKNVKVAGQDVAVTGPGPCHPFELRVQSPWGLTVVDGTVVNDAGQAGALAHAFLRSPGWFPAAGAEAMASQGAVVQIGPALLDDGDRATPNDAATLLERALQALDLDAAAGPLRFAQPDANGDGRLDVRSYDCLLYTRRNFATGYEAWKSGPVTRGAIAVERLALVDGGLTARLVVHDLRVPFSVTGNLDSGCLGEVPLTVSGDARADALLLEAQVQVGLGAGGAPEVTIVASTASLVGLTLAIDLGALDFVGLGSAIGDAIAAQVRGPAQQAMASALASLLQDRLGHALALVAGLSGSLGLPGGAAVLFTSRLDAVDFSPVRGLLTSAVQAQAVTPLPGRASTHGAPMRGGALPDLGALAGSALAVGAQDDLLNQVLFAAWQAGALDQAGLPLPVGSGFAGGKVSLFPQLPPVLIPRAGATGVDLGMGDVAFVLTLSGGATGGTLETRGYLSAVVPVDRLEAGPAGLTVVFGGAPDVRLQVDSVNWGSLPATRALTQETLQRLLAAELPPLLGQAVPPIPLPALGLAALDPALAGVTLRISAPLASRLGDYELLSGDLAGSP
jgi:hypothetical protein